MGSGQTQATPTSSKGSGWFSKIETKEHAERAIKEVSYALYVVAVIDALIGLFWQGRSMILEALFVALLGFLLQRSKSRSVALVAAAYAVFVCGLTIAAKAGVYHGSGGTNVVLALIVAYTAWRGVYAAVLYHRWLGSRVNVKHVVILTVITIVATVVVGIAILFIAAALGYDFDRDEDSNAVGSMLLIGAVATCGIVFNRLLPFTRRLNVLRPDAGTAR